MTTRAATTRASMPPPLTNSATLDDSVSTTTSLASPRVTSLPPPARPAKSPSRTSATPTTTATVTATVERPSSVDSSLQQRRRSSIKRVSAIDIVSGSSTRNSPIQSRKSSIQRGGEGDDLDGDGGARRVRTSEIPTPDRKLHNSNNKGGAKRYGVVTGLHSGASRGTAIPSVESLGLMLERAHFGEENTHHSTYQGAIKYINGRRVSEDGQIIIQPLSIKRKTPPSLDMVPHSPATPSSSSPSPRRSGRESSSGRESTISKSTTPSTPPPLTHSIYSATSTDDISLRSPTHSVAPPPPVPAALARKLSYDDESGSMPSPAAGPGPGITMYLTRPEPSLESIVHIDDGQNQDLSTYVPDACPLVAEPDIPGVIPPKPSFLHERRDSATSVSSSDAGDEFDDDDDNDDVRNFSLENFPVPSIVLASPTSPTFSPPQPPPASSSSHPDTASSIALSTPKLSQQVSHSPALTAPVIGNTPKSVQSRLAQLSPRPDLFQRHHSSAGVVATEWDLAEELEIRDRVFRAEMAKPSRADKRRRSVLRQCFDPRRPPSTKDLYEASLLSVRDEYGNRIRFGSLFEGQRTIVCFIRHFWCSQCQDYVDSVAKVKPAVLEKYGLKLVIISNGSWKMITAYKKMLGDKCPYPIYTDRGKYVYTALGMTLRTFNAGKEKDGEVGKYIKNSLGKSVVVGIGAGLKLPLKPPGDQQQLGGEFVLGPGLQVRFTHRMKSTRNHAEIEDVLASVDVDLARETEYLAPTPVVQTPALPGSPSQFSSSTASRRRRSDGTLSSVSHYDEDGRATSPATSASANTTPRMGYAKRLSSLRRGKGGGSPQSTYSSTFSHDTDILEDGEDDDGLPRRVSVPPMIPTPSPATPISFTFLDPDGQPGRMEEQRRRSRLSGIALPGDAADTSEPRDSLQVPTTPTGEAASAELESCSSRFSSSSEESDSAKKHLRGLFSRPRHLKKTSPQTSSSHSSLNGTGNGNAKQDGRRVVSPSPSHSSLRAASFRSEN